MSLALFAGSADWRSALIGGGADALSFVWFLAYWPWAIGHGQSLLFTNLVWYPHGTDLSWATPVPVAAALGWPVTWLAGPIAAYNALILAAPALAAWSCFLLAHRITRDGWAAFVAGLLFGFSAYVTGQMHGHLNLCLVFLIPLAVLVVLLRAEGAVSRAGFVAALAVVLALQWGVSVELFASLAVFGPLALALFWLVCPARRRSIARLTLETAGAGLLALAIVSPVLAHMLQSRAALQDFVNDPARYSTDLLNFVVPTELGWLAPRPLAAIAARFTGNLSEQGGYLGLPWLAVLVHCAATQWQRREIRAVLLLLALGMLASLGPFLWVAGRASGLALPWWPATQLPLLRAALPARFSVYVALAASVVAAFWLGRAGSGRGRAARFAAIGVACLAVMPDPGKLRWHPMQVPPVFAPAAWHAALGEGAHVLLLPFAGRGPGMLWQAQSGMAFTQAGGNLSFIPVDALHERVLPALLYGAAPGPDFANDLLAFCAGRQVSTVVAGPGTGPALRAALDALAWPRRATGGVVLYAVPPDAPYLALSGDVWGAMDAWSLMGRSMTATAQGAPARLVFSARLRPQAPPVEVVVQADGRAPRTLMVGGTDPVTLDLAAGETVRLRASIVFVPDVIWHNADRREIALQFRSDPAPP